MHGTQAPLVGALPQAPGEQRDESDLLPVHGRMLAAASVDAVMIIKFCGRRVFFVSRIT
jgi:hypothetical protein